MKSGTRRYNCFKTKTIGYKKYRKFPPNSGHNTWPSTDNAFVFHRTFLYRLSCTEGTGASIIYPMYACAYYTIRARDCTGSGTLVRVDILSKILEKVPSKKRPSKNGPFQKNPSQSFWTIYYFFMGIENYAKYGSIKAQINVGKIFRSMLSVSNLFLFISNRVQKVRQYLSNSSKVPSYGR